MMDLIEPALARLREYRLTLDSMQVIDPVGGLSASDIDVILEWVAAQSPALDPEGGGKLPYPARAGLRVAALVVIILIMIFAWNYAGA